MTSEISGNFVCFFQRLVRGNNKEHFKAVHYWPFVRGLQSIHHHYSDIIMSGMTFQITVGFNCLLSHLFRCRSKKTSRLHITGLCEGKPPVDSPHKGPAIRKNFSFDDLIMMLESTDIANRTDSDKDMTLRPHFTKNFQLQFNFCWTFILLWSKL